MSKGVAIIGTGHGGVQAAASLREEGYDGPVFLIGEENELPYHKPPLSKTFIKDVAAGPQILRAESFYSGNRIELRLGQRVAALAGGRVELAGGGGLDVDKIILALGSRPRRLALPGQELDGVLTLRDIGDARTIRETAAGAQDVVVMGGGFIGLEIAATLHAGGRNVTVIEAQPRILGRAVAPPIAGHVRQRLEAAGVQIVTSAAVERLEGDKGRVRAAILSSGQRLAADLVIVGVGAVPNVELAEAAGIEVANGVRVDGGMHTSAAGVLAIGDCANYRHWMTGEDVRLESVQNATDQARHAARTIAGHEGEFDAVPWFWSDIGDMKLQMVGLVGREDRHVVVGQPEENRFSVFHFAGPRITAIESVNRPADHMIGRRILATGFSPDIERLKSDPDGLKAAFAAWQAAQ